MRDPKRKKRLTIIGTVLAISLGAFFLAIPLLAGVLAKLVPMSVEAKVGQQMMDELCALDKPLVGAATGVAVCFGATALFHCDVVYVGKGLKLRLPFVSLGLVPEAASSYLLQAMIGSRPAAELQQDLAATIHPDRPNLTERLHTPAATTPARWMWVAYAAACMIAVAVLALGIIWGRR